jgi:HD-GYP domain-containing protein (c-di-GMP phosphodiesterase class II)
MTSDRPYRKALSPRIAVEELVKHSGTQFDPAIVNAFIEVLKKDYGYISDNNETIIKEKQI